MLLYIDSVREKQQRCRGGPAILSEFQGSRGDAGTPVGARMPSAALYSLWIPLKVA